MDERITSGDDGLDRILGGGLPMNGINLIMGLPGSGKTILCQQFIFASATANSGAVRISSSLYSPIQKEVAGKAVSRAARSCRKRRKSRASSANAARA